MCVHCSLTRTSAPPLPSLLYLLPPQRTLNAAARANIQSATVTDSPLTNEGLDGSGEVVQVGAGFGSMPAECKVLDVFVLCWVLPLTLRRW